MISPPSPELQRAMAPRARRTNEPALWFRKEPNCTHSTGPPWQSSLKSRQRVVNRAVYLDPLLHHAFPAAKPSLTRNSDLIDAGLPGRGLDSIDQLTDLLFEIVERDQ